MALDTELLPEIYEIYEEWLNPHSSKEYKEFLDLYIQTRILQSAPRGLQEGYETYWETLKKNKGIRDDGKVL